MLCCGFFLICIVDKRHATQYISWHSMLIGMLCPFSVLLTLHATVVLSDVMCRLNNAMEVWLQLTSAASDHDLNIQDA